MSVKMTVFALALLVAAIGCAGDRNPIVDAPPVIGPVSADELSYRHEPLLSEAGAVRSVFDAPDPGDSILPARAFENAPPVIPHSVEGLLPITASENACADCHLPEAAAEVEATPVPASHLYDLRRGTPLDGLAGANYHCTLCHAPQASAPDLVENTFVPDYRAAKLKARSNLLEIVNEGVE